MSDSSESNKRESSTAQPFSVDRIASLAKLAPDDLEQLESQMQRILGFVGVLDELDLDGVEPFFGATDLRLDGSRDFAWQPIRDDQPTKGLSRDQALKNSPIADDEYYIVPPVFE